MKSLANIIKNNVSDNKLETLKFITSENQSSDFKNAIGHFVDGIYKDSFHFFLELIQNADDACKNSNTGRLNIIITTDKQIKFEYDDRGFNFSDLYAITSLGNSTKKGKLDTDSEIGEKGIGFKSIFAIATKVDIKSKYFSFSIKANKDTLQNVLLPHEITLYNSSNSNYTTIITLTLNDNLKGNDEFWININKWMTENVQCSEYGNPFMFLKNIKEVSFIDENNTKNLIESIKIKKDPLINDENSHYIETIGEKKYFVYKDYISLNEAAIISRWPYLKTELELKKEKHAVKREMQVAFPVNPSQYGLSAKSY